MTRASYIMAGLLGNKRNRHVSGFFSIWREFIHNSVTHADDFAKMNFEMCKYLQNCPSRNENAQISYSVRLFLLPERQIPSRKQHKSQGFESERNKNLGVYFLNRKYLPIYYCPASVMHFNFGTIEWQEMRLLPLLKLDDFASWNQFKIQNVFKTIHYLVLYHRSFYNLPEG